MLLNCKTDNKKRKLSIYSIFEIDSTILQCVDYFIYCVVKKKKKKLKDECKKKKNNNNKKTCLKVLSSNIFIYIYICVCVYIHKSYWRKKE